MKQKLSNLIEIRKIVTLLVITLFITLALKGTLDPKVIEYVIISVISYYFGKSTALDKPRSDK